MGGAGVAVLGGSGEMVVDGVCQKARRIRTRPIWFKWRRDALAGDVAVAVVDEMKWCTHKKLLHFRILGGGSHGATLA